MYIRGKKKIKAFTKYARGKKIKARFIVAGIENQGFTEGTRR